MRHITKQALVLSGHTGSVFSVAFSPNARLIASGSGDGTVRVWDINTGTAKVRPLWAHADSVWSVAFSPEGDRIASGSRDCTIIIWNAHDGSILAPFTRQTGPVMSVSLSPRGNLIASGSTNHAVCIWDARSGAALAGPLWKHSDCVSVVAFSPDGTRVASGSHDRNIYVWDAYTGSVVAGPFQHNMSRVLSIAFSRDGSRIVSGSRNGTICVVDASSGVVQTTLRLSRSRCVFSVDFSPDGTHIVSGSANNTICLSDSHTGSILAKLSQDRPDPIHSVTFSPDGNQIAAGCGNGNITILPVRIARSISRQDVPTHNYFETPLVPIPAARARYTDVFISRQLSSTEMFQLLVQHGCIDLSSNIDPDGFSSVMVAGGSFGDIWRGRLLDGTAVAIKVWRITSMPQDDPKQLKRTVREIYNWSKVKHENVQELMGVLMFQGRLGMVSLWMDYGNLREYILNHPYVDRYPLCSQVAAGLSYLHTNDMVHGDLKAVNVLVSRNGVAKLNDFDHSIMFECSLLFSETSRPGGGTTRWMAPELLLGSDDDVSLPRRSKQADVYALGMTMLEIITGTVPYPECNNEPRVITKLIGKILPVRSAMHFRNSRRDNHMWELLVSCWNYEPAARPTAAEVLESVKFIAVL